MAIDTISPVASSQVDPGTTLSFIVDNTYTTIQILIETASGYEYAYDSSLSGAQTGYTVVVTDLVTRDKFAVTRNAGFNLSPFNIKVIENETGSSATTTTSYTLALSEQFPDGVDPYFADSIGDTFLSHSDTPSSYAGQGDKFLKVKATVDGIEFVAAAGVTDADAIHDNVAGEITALTGKANPDDNDVFLIEDSAAGNVKKKLVLSNLLASLSVNGGLGIWQYAGDADTTPASAKFSFDTSGIGIADHIYVHENSLMTGVDIGALVADLQVGDYVFFGHASLRTVGSWHKVNGTPTLTTNVWDIPIDGAGDSSTVSYTLDDYCYMGFWAGGRAAGSHVTSDGSSHTGVVLMDGSRTQQHSTFDTAPASPPTAEGSVFWDEDDHCLAFKSDIAGTTMQVGQENWVRVYNDTGVQIDNGSICYVSGAEGVEGRPTVGLAQADDAATSNVVGVATEDIPDATFGYVTQFGLIRDIDTSAIAAGSTVWLSETAAGGFTDTQPEAPNFSVRLGYVLVTNATTGVGFITTLGNTGTAPAGGASEVYVAVRKGSAGTITAGKPVYISGYNVGQEVIEVEEADADDPTKMPAFGLTSGSVTNSANGLCVTSGKESNVDTSAWSVGDALYVSTTAGTLTNVKPTAEATQIQKIGTVSRSNATKGVIYVTGAGRSNDVPNTLTLPEQASITAPGAGFGEFWVRDDAPSVPVFTDDAGTDFVLNAGAGKVIGLGTWTKGNDTIGIPAAGAFDVNNAIIPAVTQIRILASNPNGGAPINGFIGSVEQTGTLLLQDISDPGTNDVYFNVSSHVLTGGAYWDLTGTVEEDYGTNWATEYSAQYLPDAGSGGGFADAPDGALFTERADHVNTPAAGFGELWLKSDATKPTLVFTRDDGVDYELTNTDGANVNNALAIWQTSGTQDFLADISQLTWSAGELKNASANAEISVGERAASPTNEAGFGHFWVRNDTPTVPMFTQDDGTEHILLPTAYATSMGKIGAPTTTNWYTSILGSSFDNDVDWDSVVGANTSSTPVADYVDYIDGSIFTAPFDGNITNIRLSVRPLVVQEWTYIAFRQQWSATAGTFTEISNSGSVSATGGWSDVDLTPSSLTTLAKGDSIGLLWTISDSSPTASDLSARIYVSFEAS